MDDPRDVLCVANDSYHDAAVDFANLLLRAAQPYGCPRAAYTNSKGEIVPPQNYTRLANVVARAVTSSRSARVITMEMLIIAKWEIECRRVVNDWHFKQLKGQLEFPPWDRRMTNDPWLAAHRQHAYFLAVVEEAKDVLEGAYLAVMGYTPANLNYREVDNFIKYARKELKL